MLERIKKEFIESVSVKEKCISELPLLIESSVRLITEAFKAGNKLLIFGNGGSAADSQHIAGEFIGRFKKERRSLPAIALTTDTSIITSLANDYDYEIVFARQIEGLGKKGDVAFGLSTSGNSKNVLKGLKKAKEMGLKTIGLLGCGGGTIAEVCDISIVVPSSSTPRVQESQMTVYHIICGLVEEEMFKK